jgi:hypothetical protein
VVRIEDGACIPNDPANRDWVEYEAWLGDGGVPDPYVPPKPEMPELIATEDAVFLNHENRIRAIEGRDKLTLKEFFQLRSSMREE